MTCKHLLLYIRMHIPVYPGTPSTTRLAHAPPISSAKNRRLTKCMPLGLRLCRMCETPGTSRSYYALVYEAPCLTTLKVHIGKKTQGVQSTYIVECRVSILGITIMIWEGTPHNQYLGPFVKNMEIGA